MRSARNVAHSFHCCSCWVLLLTMFLAIDRYQRASCSLCVYPYPPAAGEAPTVDFRLPPFADWPMNRSQGGKMAPHCCSSLRKARATPVTGFEQKDTALRELRMLPAQRGFGRYSYHRNFFARISSGARNQRMRRVGVSLRMHDKTTGCSFLIQLLTMSLRSTPHAPQPSATNDNETPNAWLAQDYAMDTKALR